MTTGIRFRRLALRGLNRDYGPSLLRDGRAAGLALISGEISTGKSTILDFIDYCLGSTRHPVHPELVEVSIRTALLELEVNGELCVIERGCFPASPTVTIHWTGIEGLADEHAREDRPVRPAGDPTSLSSFLLEALGLAGIRLKEAPTQASSGADPLSFRDIMGVTFIDNDRLGSDHLLLESNRMKALKLTQVIDVIFSVHEDAAAELSAAINEAQTRRDTVRHEIATLTKFLAARAIASADQATMRLEAIAVERAHIATLLTEIDQHLRGTTAVADEMREQYRAAVEQRRLSDARVRDRETLRERLQVLNGQYAADISRLEFSIEVGRLFDDLQVKVCPACRSDLATPPGVVDGACTLCGAVLMDTPPDIDVRRELESTRTRLKELQAYLSTVAQEIEAARSERDQALRAEASARTSLDTATAGAVAPFVAQRDALLGRHRELAEERTSLETAQRLRAGIVEHDNELSRLTRELSEMRERLAALEQHRQTRAELRGDLSSRFASILQSFGLHKLESPQLDARYTPYNRGLPYTDLSSGTKTLMSLAWALALLELAVERGQPHPGFLMVDGISKNLTPTDGAGQEDPDIRPDIIERVYVHVMAWTAGPGRDAQILFVDNRPPRRAEASVVVRYSSEADQPPFGLIEDAIG